jgi:formate hydrogenlyase subunit 3/multisubunit Na+/H+ antiporter MnhD subunit
MDAWLLLAAVMAPFCGALVGFALGGRWMRRVAWVTIAAGTAIAYRIVVQLFAGSGEPLTYLLGGWSPPLGLALTANVLSAMMIGGVAVVVCGIGAFAHRDFGERGDGETRAPFMFWPLLLAVWGALNLAFVSNDLFTLYVALELLTFGGVPLVCLDGRAETLRAALRYVLFALVGSILYLAGCVLLYGAYGTLDITLLAQRVAPQPVTWTATAIMTVGLLAKTALFPLHLWLPPAHAGAPAAGSATLSALVIKGSWFVAVRVWYDVMGGVVTFPAAQVLAALGAAAIVFASILALRQERLKLLVAYSTLAQIGYLFLMFPLAYDVAAGAMTHGPALAGGVLQALSHATAKAAMFMAAGLLYSALGHDRIAGLAGAAKAMPLTVAAFALSGVALMGIFPSGAYVAKKLMLDAADASGQWWWEIVLNGGAIFTAGYVALVLSRALRSRPEGPVALVAPVSKLSELAALFLAVMSFLLAVANVAAIGNPLSLKELGNTAMVIGGGVILSLVLARRFDAARAGWNAVALCAALDRTLRRWSPAGLCLLLLAVAFGAAMGVH